MVMTEPQMWEGHLVLVHSSERLGFLDVPGVRALRTGTSAGCLLREPQ